LLDESDIASDGRNAAVREAKRCIRYREEAEGKSRNVTVRSCWRQPMMADSEHTTILIMHDHDSS
jgi:hypothetical protein